MSHKPQSTMIDKKKGIIRVQLPVILFKDGNIYVAYCPAVNVYGYGATEGEAKKSFEVSLSEFFRYTINKDTLASELEALGWKVRHGSKYSPPEFSALLSKNADVQAIVNTKPFKKFDRGVNIPLSA